MSWNDCKPIIAAAMAAGYDFWPVPKHPDDDGYAIIIYDRSGQQLETARGSSWTEAARAAVALVERVRRAAA